MTEEEFVALLAIEGKKLFTDKYNFRTKNSGTKPHYVAVVLTPDSRGMPDVYEESYMTDWYRSRAYAIQKLIKIYYENHR